MTNQAVAYGNSLYDLSVEENLSQKMFEEVEGVKALLADNPDYIKLLSEPSVSKDDRIKLIDDAFKGKIETYLLNFLKILCENGCIGSYAACAKQFRKRYLKDNGFSEAVVTSAYRLDESQLNALKAKLEEKTGKKIILAQKVDDKFIAGLRVEFDGIQYDSTVSRRLEEMKNLVTDII